MDLPESAPPSIRYRLMVGAAAALLLAIIQGLFLLLHFGPVNGLTLEARPRLLLIAATGLGLTWGLLAPGLPGFREGRVRTSGWSILGYGLLPALMALQGLRYDRRLESLLVFVVSTIAGAWVLAKFNQLLAPPPSAGARGPGAA